MKLQPWDVFLLTRLVGNLKGSQVDKLFEALDREAEAEEEEEQEERRSLVDHNEGKEINDEMEMA
jgi:hypothetical protein